MKRIIAILFILISFSFAERFEINYSSYIVSSFNSKTKAYDGNPKEYPHVQGSLVVAYNDSAMMFTALGKAYYLVHLKYYETVNDANDSIAMFEGINVKDGLLYTIAIGYDYTNLVMNEYWKLKFVTPQELNQNESADNSASESLSIVSGSSFAITKHELVTNRHVVKGLDQIWINNGPESKNGYLKANVLYEDSELDLAVLHTDSNLTACEIDRKVYDIGEDVYVYGYPETNRQGLSLKLTKGVISSKRGLRDDVKYYQIDAAVQHGNSGGPLVRNGKIIGIVSSGLSDLQNVNYAIKSGLLGVILDNLNIKNTGKASPKNCTYFVLGFAE